MVPVSEVPDLVMLALIRQFTPADQLIARQVCRRWKELVREAAQARSKLTIIINGLGTSIDGDIGIGSKLVKQSIGPLGESSQDHFEKLTYANRRLNKFNSLTYEKFSLDLASELTSTFTGVKHLQLIVAFIHPLYITGIPSLLTNWQQQLVSLEFTERLAAQKPLEIDSIMDAINNMDVLANLKIDFQDFIVRSPIIFSRLSLLSFHASKTSIADFVDLLDCYSYDNQALSQLALQSKNISGDEAMHQLALLPEHLRTKFSYLDFQSPITELHFLVNNFALIRRLELDVLEGFTLMNLYMRLSQLPCLHMLSFAASQEMLDSTEDVHRLNPKLLSIQLVRITFAMQTHFDLHHLQMDQAMPNLRRLHVCHSPHSTCALCNFTILAADNLNASGRATRQKCLGISFFFKFNFDHPPLISYDLQDTFGQAESLPIE